MSRTLVGAGTIVIITLFDLKRAVHYTLFFQSRKQETQKESVFSIFFLTTVYDIYVHNIFLIRVIKEKKRNHSIIQKRCRLSRIRLETFYLQLEVPNLRVRIAQIGVESIVIILQSGGGSRSFAVLINQKCD